MDFSKDFTKVADISDMSLMGYEDTDGILGSPFTNPLNVTDESILLDDISFDGPLCHSSPKKKGPRYNAPQMLSTSLPYPTNATSIHDTTVPEKYLRSPIEAIDQTVGDKLVTLQRKKAMKQQEIDMMYVENAKYSENISTVKKEIQNLSQKFNEKDKECAALVDLNTSLKEEAFENGVKVEEVHEASKAMGKINNLPNNQLKENAQKLENKLAQLRLKNNKIWKLERQVRELEKRVEDPKKDRQISELESELFATFEQLCYAEMKGDELMKSNMQSVIDMGANLKSIIAMKAGIKEGDAKIYKLDCQISERSIILHKHKGVFHKNHTTTDAIINDLENVIVQNKCWKKQCARVQKQNVALAAKLNKIKKNYTPAADEVGTIKQLQRADLNKAALIKDVRSLRAIIFNARQSLKDTAAKDDEKTLKKCLVKLQKTLASCEAKNWKKSESQTAIAEKAMDYSCDLNALKWCNIRN